MERGGACAGAWQRTSRGGGRGGARPARRGEERSRRGGGGGEERGRDGGEERRGRERERLGFRVAQKQTLTDVRRQ